jgi:hypothetical protein
MSHFYATETGVPEAKINAIGYEVAFGAQKTEQ